MSSQGSFAAAVVVSPMQVFVEESVDTVRPEQSVRRAAFDIGGGSIRMVVADVDITNNRIIHKLLSAKIPVLFREELSRSDQLSKDIEEVALEAVIQLQQRAKQYCPDSYSAVATEAFRIAKNGKEFLLRLQMKSSVPITLIEQEQEGKLGFLAGVANSRVSTNDVVIVDIGTGSAQITGLKADGAFDVFMTKLGSVVIKELINMTDYVTEYEAFKVADEIHEKLTTMSDFLKEKISSEETKVILTCDSPAGEKRWNEGSARDFIMSNINCKPMDMKSSVVKAIMIYSLLHGLHIKELETTGTDSREGSASGLLISKEFWENSL